jgi:hypothetical protein
MEWDTYTYLIPHGMVYIPYGIEWGVFHIEWRVFHMESIPHGMIYISYGIHTSFHMESILQSIWNGVDST